jgi:O-antigen ligase
MALWIPAFWIGIIGSRPISAWLGLGGAANELDGSPADRLLYTVLIFAALVVLVRRQVNWLDVLARNRWLSIYFIYLGISTVWADHPFVSLKRWIKDIGNLLMVLVVLSEADPASAMKNVLLKCCSFLVPMSVLYIRYYPQMGRYFDRWSWQYSYGGVTTDKNSLGMSLFLCGIGLFWSFMDIWAQRASHKKDIFAHLLLILMCLWLWHTANCATSLACSVVGLVLLVALRKPVIQTFVQRVGFLGLFIPFLIIVSLSLVFNPFELLTSVLGRDMTFTGRTLIWQRVLHFDINPIFGAGYFSFWDGPRADEISNDLGFFFRIQEAHDGYLETYLNGGLIGLTLILTVLFGGFRKAASRVGVGGSFDAFRLAIIFGLIFYNVTESGLCGLETLWIALLLVVVEPLPSAALKKAEDCKYGGNDDERTTDGNDSICSSISAASCPG